MMRIITSAFISITVCTMAFAGQHASDGKQLPKATLNAAQKAKSEHFTLYQKPSFKSQSLRPMLPILTWCLFFKINKKPIG